MPIELIESALNGVHLLEARSFGDTRGYFLEVYKKSNYKQLGIGVDFVQDNLARSEKAVLRGLHYQKEPYAQDKLVYVIRGAVFDVAVDLRKGSPSFGMWYGTSLSEDNHRALFIPRGFAHGYVVQSVIADVAYKVSTEYHAESERGFIWNDPTVGVDWQCTEPKLSKKDIVNPTLQKIDNNYNWSTLLPCHSFARE